MDRGKGRVYQLISDSIGLLLLCEGRVVYHLNVGSLAWVTIALVDEGGGLVPRKGSRICQQCAGFGAVDSRGESGRYRG